MHNPLLNSQTLNKAKNSELSSKPTTAYANGNSITHYWLVLTLSTTRPTMHAMRDMYKSRPISPIFSFNPLERARSASHEMLPPHVIHIWVYYPPIEF